MRKVHIDKVVVGVKLAKLVYSSEGRVLLDSGVELKRSFIEKLRDYNIKEIYIEDDISRDLEINDIVCEKTRIEAKILVRNLMDSYVSSNLADVEQLREIVDKIIGELLSNPDILINLSDIKLVDDYTFEHSVNVCILSLITGIGLGFNTLRLKDLGIGALLHDIGKLKVPEDILKKPSQLTVEEFEEIKKHTIYGYEILKDTKNVSMVSAFIAFGHHERIDGSGYPLQLKGENIHNYARIVAVADVYDALTSNRVYRSRLDSYEVFEYITSLGYQRFDQDVLNSFIRYIAAYPIGSGVILSTRERGIVTGVNKSMPTRPVVRVVYDADEKKLERYKVRGHTSTRCIPLWKRYVPF